jgi:hypothetical protein
MAALVADSSESMLFKDRQTSKPERTRSLPNRHLDLSDEHFIMEAAGDLGGVGGFEKQRQGLDQIHSGFFDRSALARDIQLGAQGDKAVILTLDDGR